MSKNIKDNTNNEHQPSITQLCFCVVSLLCVHFCELSLCSFTSLKLLKTHNEGSLSRCASAYCTWLSWGHIKLPPSTTLNQYLMLLIHNFNVFCKHNNQTHKSNNPTHNNSTPIAKFISVRDISQHFNVFYAFFKFIFHINTMFLNFMFFYLN